MDNTRISLAKYRLEKALSCLNASQINLDNNLYETSLNRSYYAIFHSARAILALDGEDRKKHSGVISYFQENYIKTKIFDRHFSRIISDAFEVRIDSDYEDFFIVSHEDVKTQLQGAKIFYEEMKQYVENRINE